ncbi:MAG: hypothetical protein KDD51_06520 [Bdellovibrionales bacterium]|nr:hypothetical protein [Bdellovibrionales bacterium]
MVIQVVKVFISLLFFAYSFVGNIAYAQSIQKSPQTSADLIVLEISQSQS